MNLSFQCAFQASPEMARAETIESVGETGGGGNGPLSHHNTCHMGLPQAFHNLHGLLTTTTITTGSGTDPTHLHHNHHPAHPFQAVYLPCLLPYLHPEDQEEPQTHQHLATLSASPSPTPPPSPRCNPLGDRGAGFSGEHSGKIMVFVCKRLWTSAAMSHEFIHVGSRLEALEENKNLSSVVIANKLLGSLKILWLCSSLICIWSC